MTDICRLCATVKTIDELLNIKDPYYSIETQVYQSCQINLSDDEHLPQNACTDCFQSLNTCIGFINGIIRAQETLKEAFYVKLTNNFDDEITVLEHQDDQELEKENLKQSGDEFVKSSKRKNKSPIKRENDIADEDFIEVLKLRLN